VGTLFLCGLFGVLEPKEMDSISIPGTSVSAFVDSNEKCVLCAAVFPVWVLIYCPICGTQSHPYVVPAQRLARTSVLENEPRTLVHICAYSYIQKAVYG